MKNNVKILKTDLEKFTHDIKYNKELEKYFMDWLKEKYNINSRHDFFKTIFKNPIMIKELLEEYKIKKGEK